MTTITRQPVCDLTRLRRRMEAAGIDLILASSRRNVGWLTDHQTTYWTWEHAILHMMEKEYDGEDYVLFAGVPLDPGKGTFLVEYAHREEAIRRRGLFADDYYGYWRQGRVPDQCGTAAPGCDFPGICLEQGFTRTALESAVAAILDRDLAAGTIGVELARLPASLYHGLRERLPRARFVDAFELMFDERQIKTAEEIRRLRRAYEVATGIYRNIFSSVLAGDTPRGLLLREMNQIYREECTFSFAHIFFGSGGLDIAYSPPADRAIEPGDVGVFDLGVVYEGYGTDYARMAQVGAGNPKLTEVYPAFLRGRRAVEAALRPGAAARDVFLAGARALEESGLCASISCIGHGIGQDCHEKPFLTAYSDDVIREGQTVVIEAYCEVRGLGPVLVEDGGMITADGWQCFSDLPLDIVQVQ